MFTFDQRGQNVGGAQVNVGGDVRDPVRAAAYDLLAACEALVSAGAVPDLGALPNTETAIGDAARMVRAAIAKAKGERDGTETE